MSDPNGPFYKSGVADAGSGAAILSVEPEEGKVIYLDGICASWGAGTKETSCDLKRSHGESDDILQSITAGSWDGTLPLTGTLTGLTGLGTGTLTGAAMKAPAGNEYRHLGGIPLPADTISAEFTANILAPAGDSYVNIAFWGRIGDPPPADQPSMHIAGIASAQAVKTVVDDATPVSTALSAANLDDLSDAVANKLKGGDPLGISGTVAITNPLVEETPTPLLVQQQGNMTIDSSTPINVDASGSLVDVNTDTPLNTHVTNSVIIDDEDPINVNVTDLTLEEVDITALTNVQFPQGFAEQPPGEDN